MFKLIPAILSAWFFGVLTVFSQGVYPSVEAAFQVNSLSTNPVVLFDYTQTDIQAQILQPDNSTLSLPAFYDGGTTWRVRMTPVEAGNYQITGFTLNGSPLTVSNLQPAAWTVTGFPTGPGFVRVDPANSNRFITSDGRRFFPVGQDVAWSSPTSDILDIFPKMGAAHENWSRVWMTHFYDNGTTLGLNLDWPKVNNTFGDLSLTNARHWDAIVNAAALAGLHFQMVLQHHGQYASTNGSNTDPNWEQNPYNIANGGFLANATNFFTDPTAIALTKVKWRYIIARWGYSPAVMAWEMFNEVQFTDAGYYNQWSTIEAWCDEMATFLRSQDPYHHLITISSDLSEPIWDETDYYQHHDYPEDLITGIRDPDQISPSQPIAPEFSGECGINFTPHVGVSPPVWAGLMAAQSGGAMPWYWDTIDPDNDYYLIQAAADFVTQSGLADQNTLTKTAPTVTGGAPGPLTFSPGGGWATATQSAFAVGQTAPDGIDSAPSYLQGQYHRAMTPEGYTFIADYPQNGTFSVQVVQVAQSGAGLEIFLDGALKTNISFPAAGSDTTTNFTATIPVSAGSHSILITNNGLDWILLGNITLSPLVPGLSAYAIGTNDWQAAWIWNITNVFATNAGSTIAGTIAIAGLDAGVYSGTWWDTFGAGAISNFSFTVATNQAVVTAATPPVLRSMALYVGIPAKAGIVASTLSETASATSSPTNLSIVITNSGGLPLSYSVTATNGLPGWISLSSTNGYIGQSGMETLSVAFNSTGLSPGTHTFTLFVDTGDPALPQTTLPLTLTILPSAPRLQALETAQNLFVFQLQGETNVAYVVQTSTNLLTWTSVSTNTLTNGVWDVTNSLPASALQEFWRAVWESN